MNQKDAAELGEGREMTKGYQSVDAGIERGDSSKEAYQDRDITVEFHFTGLCAIVP